MTATKIEKDLGLGKTATKIEKMPANEEHSQIEDFMFWQKKKKLLEIKLLIIQTVLPSMQKEFINRVQYEQLFCKQVLVKNRTMWF